MTILSGYRDASEGARIRYVELLEARSGLARASAVIAARTGRIWAGTAGIAGAVLLVLAATASTQVPGIRLTSILLLSWPAMLAAYALGTVVAAGRATSPPPTGDVQTDLAQLEAARPVAFVRDRAHALEHRSAALPMIAVALLAPLTIHVIVAVLFKVSAGPIETWIKWSLVLVGHAHLYLAYRCHVFARDAGIRDSSQLELAVSDDEVTALGWTFVVSAIPGAVFFLIPPLLTAATGILFIPFLFRGMTRTLVAERKALDA